jgi:ATP-dependent DNA helicase RecQ
MEVELRKFFGFSSFKPGQKQVIEAIMRGERALAVFPTGGRKSLCYMLPSVLLPGLTVVVSFLLFVLLFLF